jgi:hypothetical protein
MVVWKLHGNSKGRALNIRHAVDVQGPAAPARKIHGRLPGTVLGKVLPEPWRSSLRRA